nr:hypothetical protein [Actinomadura montaniterrae]
MKTALQGPKGERRHAEEERPGDEGQRGEHEHQPGHRDGDRSHTAEPLEHSRAGHVAGHSDGAEDEQHERNRVLRRPEAGDEVGADDAVHGELRGQHHQNGRQDRQGARRKHHPAEAPRGRRRSRPERGQ